MAKRPTRVDDPADPATWTPAFKLVMEAAAGGGNQVVVTDGITTGVPKGFVAPQIRDSSGQFVPRRANPYDINNEANVILASMEPVKRNRLLTEMWRRGMYTGKTKPGNGVSDRDRAVFADLLRYANAKGVDWEPAFGLLRQEFPPDTGLGTGAGGGGFRVTPSQDVVRSIDDASAQALGRKFTDQVTSGLVKQIQGREAAGDRTSLGQMSVAAAGKVAPDEAEAFKFAQYAQVFERMLGK